MLTDSREGRLSLFPKGSSELLVGVWGGFSMYKPAAILDLLATLEGEGSSRSESWEGSVGEIQDGSQLKCGNPGVPPRI